MIQGFNDGPPPSKAKYARTLPGTAIIDELPVNIDNQRVQLLSFLPPFLTPILILVLAVRHFDITVLKDQGSMNFPFLASCLFLYFSFKLISHQ